MDFAQHNADLARHEVAVDWAAYLVRSLHMMTLPNLKTVWEGKDGQGHRAQLRRSNPAMLTQLADYVRERVDELKAQAAESPTP